MDIPMHKKKMPVAKSGHMWIKAIGVGKVCLLCGCRHESKTIYHYPDKYKREHINIYTINGEEYRESPVCTGK